MTWRSIPQLVPQRWRGLESPWFIEHAAEPDSALDCEQVELGFGEPGHAAGVVEAVSERGTGS